MIDKSSSKWINWNYEKKKKKLTETLELTFTLFKQNKSIEEIAKEREFKLQTVEYQIIELITLGFIPISELVDETRQKKILEVIDSKIPESLKLIKEKLPENYSYFQIKCVLAELNRNP